MSNFKGLNLQFETYLSSLLQKGHLVYEYNAFRNYRLDKDHVEIDGKLIEYNDSHDNLIDNGKAILLKKGTIVDFITNEFNFSLNHPVKILPQYSYDGTVNLILNDGLNKPRLINSRFTVVGENKYEIYDRKGSDDNNLYDLGGLFDIDTSLNKITNKIVKFKYEGLSEGGFNRVGNYSFYLKLADNDGNETDYIYESGLIHVYIGNNPTNINTGIRDENSNKIIKFTVSNIDDSYKNLVIYYTRSTSDYLQNSIIQAYKIELKFIVKNKECKVILTGLEDKSEVSLEDINSRLNVINNAYTHESVLNLMFMGNINKEYDYNYLKLEKIALLFKPEIHYKDYNPGIDEEYRINNIKESYYDSKFIYDFTGYWQDEYYRLGVVFILPNGELSHVFNISGCNDFDNPSNQGNLSLINKIEDIIIDDNYSINKSKYNSKGLIHITPFSPKNTSETFYHKISYIRIKPHDGKYNLLYNELKKHCKGFYFVRQKRIPTIIGLGLVVGNEYYSNLPFFKSIEGSLIERFMDDNQRLNNDFDSRLYKVNEELSTRKYSVYFPDYTIDYPRLNSIINDKLSFIKASYQIKNKKDNNRILDKYDNHYFIKEYEYYKPLNYILGDFIGLEDSVKLVNVGKYNFSAQAGNPKEAWRVSYIEKKNKTNSANNLVRGLYSPYLGMVANNVKINDIITLKIPGFVKNKTLFDIRYNDNSSYFNVSDRFDVNEFVDGYEFNIFRGDCFICQFTQRVNRNFAQEDNQTNDIIIDYETWKNNFDFKNKEKLNKINLADVNNVQLGSWLTFTIYSSYNLNIRTIDERSAEETAIYGHGFGYFPYHPMSTRSVYKHKESLIYNKGFSKSTNERVNFLIADVPYIKNEFSTRIVYSDINVNNAYKNGFRTYQLTHYRDYPKSFGLIIKLVEWNNNLVCVFEHAITIIPVNERAVAAEGSGGLAYINTSNVLPENLNVLSDTFGSQWYDSILKTLYYIYGVDTVAKKIWRTNGGQVEIISDFKVLEFLINNISLSERELNPVIGIRNVKTHYNEYKHDVMFTFYDNIYGYEEKAWNLCFNEVLNKFQTFYSWLPSFSENIDNIYFSFNRDVSKWIAKLGVSKSDNSFSDGIVCSEVVFKEGQSKIGKLSIVNRNMPFGGNVKYKIKFSIDRDIYGNYKYFEIKNDNELHFIDNYKDVCSELFARDLNGVLIKPLDQNYNLNLPIYKIDDQRFYLNRNECKNPDKIVRLLNIKADIFVEKNETKVLPNKKNKPNKMAMKKNFWHLIDDLYEDLKDKEKPESEKEYYLRNKTISINAGYYKSTIAVIPEYNMQFLETDFWKHGQAGIIDIREKIKPTNWYGKQHPFEFEFIVVDHPNFHKIFDNLEIYSNKAEPESFHYEIIGECYDFHNDKINMFIRQELTKDLYLFNEYDVIFDRKVYDIADLAMLQPKSTIFPLYYTRQDTINDIEDYYKQVTSKNKNYDHLTGTEVVYYENLKEFRLWTHSKATKINPNSRLRGNMLYLEDKWNVQILPINLEQKNEEEWRKLIKVRDNDKKFIVWTIEISYNDNGVIKKALDRNWRTEVLKPKETNDSLIKNKEGDLLELKVLLKNELGYHTTFNDLGFIDLEIKDKQQKEIERVKKELNDEKYTVKAVYDISDSSFGIYYPDYEIILSFVPLIINNTLVDGVQPTLDTLQKGLSDNLKLLGFEPSDIQEHLHSNDNPFNFSVFKMDNSEVKDYARKREEIKLKDKFIKIRVRYSGHDLAVITGLKTIYSISFA